MMDWTTANAGEYITLPIFLIPQKTKGGSRRIRPLPTRKVN
jgi:hypothetical protein